MKRRFAALFAAALISMFGVVACADQLQQEAEQRAREEIDKQVDKGRQEVEKQVQKGRTEAEKKLQEGRQQVEKKVKEGAQ
jgi:vacuolar-type H+-ATPase subunit H